ncbi:putative uncharacterized protein [Clostridium sp. CAG:510]|nr:putative uncharacterized protein [Clostridium sp. CAG:510]
MGCGIHMNMNATLFPCNGSCMTELPYNLLNGWDVCIFTDGGYKLHFVFIPAMGSILFPCHNTGIIHNLPLSSLIVIYTVFLVISTIILTTASQIFCYNLRRFLSGQTGQFNFNPEFLLPHIHRLTSSYLPPALPNSFSLYSGACTIRLYLSLPHL